jgi:hypothetical protein
MHAAWLKASEVDVWPWRCMCDTASLVHGGTLFFRLSVDVDSRQRATVLSAADEDDDVGGRTCFFPDAQWHVSERAKTFGAARRSSTVLARRCPACHFSHGKPNALALDPATCHALPVSAISFVWPC